MFGGPAAGSIGMWIRQKSVDGQAVIRADARSGDGAEFKGLQIFNFDDKGNFVERLEAASGELHDGYWVLHNAVVVTPGFETMPGLHLPSRDKSRSNGGRPGVRRA